MVTRCATGGAEEMSVVLVSFVSWLFKTLEVTRSRGLRTARVELLVGPSDHLFHDVGGVGLSGSAAYGQLCLTRAMNMRHEANLAQRCIIVSEGLRPGMQGVAYVAADFSQ